MSKPLPMPVGTHRPRRVRVWGEGRMRLGRETDASGTRDGCAWDERRMRLGREADAPGTRDGCAWDERRMRLGRETDAPGTRGGCTRGGVYQQKQVTNREVWSLALNLFSCFLRQSPMRNSFSFCRSDYAFHFGIFFLNRFF